MEESDKYKLCNQWISEYYCWRMWTEFSKFGTVEEWIKKVTVWYCCSCPDNAGDRKSHGCLLLMRFMCKIAEFMKEKLDDVASKSQHDATPGESLAVLEDAIDLLDYISTAFSSLKGSSEMKELQLCLRRFAVLAPLCKDDQATAKVPFWATGKKRIAVVWICGCCNS